MCRGRQVLLWLSRVAAKLRTPVAGSAEPQSSSGAHIPQCLAWRSCSWAAGRVFSSSRQVKGFAHLALKCAWVFWVLGCISVSAPIPWTFPQLMSASKSLGPGQHPKRCRTESCSLQPTDHRGGRLGAPWAEEE